MRASTGSLKIARIRGVDLELHVSLLLLLPYLIFVTAARFPLLVKDAGLEQAAMGGTPVIWGIVVSIGLLVSIILHEFGHVFAAQSLGVKVKGVTLMMLGGVSSMEQIPEKKFSEFKLAIVGPLVSLGLSGFFFALEARVQSPDIIFFSYWLGSLNLMLAIFNLLPAFPMDGGRALRSLLAVRQGMVRATQTSVKISKGFAWALGILGLLGFNILLMLIAFFIYSAAQSELFFLLSRGILKGLSAGEVAIKITAITWRDSLSTAAERMLAGRTAVLPVAVDTSVIKLGRGGGTTVDSFLVTLEQLQRVPQKLWSVTLVKDVMEKASSILSVNDQISEVLPALTAARLGTLPVQENGNLVGVLRYSDVAEILQFRSLTQPEEIAEKQTPNKAA